MKHALVLFTLAAPRADLAPCLLARHDAYLRAGQDQGWFLFHGRLAEAGGDLAVARTRSRKALEAFLRDDPLVLGGAATVSCLAFEPLAYPEVLRGWMRPLAVGPDAEEDTGLGV